MPARAVHIVGLSQSQTYAINMIHTILTYWPENITRRTKGTLRSYGTLSLTMVLYEYISNLKAHCQNICACLYMYL
jgi:hypothetical protein